MPSQQPSSSLIKATLSWQEIASAEKETQIMAGAIYKVPSLGAVWVSNRDASESKDGALCDLVAFDEEQPDKRLWAIVRIRKPGERVAS
jgi:hypothetical protein